MQVSHETIYRALYVQARGTLRRELTRHLRRGRSGAMPARNRQRARARASSAGMVMISERPPEVEDRAVPGHWEGDLLIGDAHERDPATLVERQTRYCQLVALPEGSGAQAVCEALKQSIITLPAQLRRSLTWYAGLGDAESTGASRSSRGSRSTSAIPEAPGSGALTRTPTACFASTSRSERASPGSARSASTRSPRSSTAARARRSASQPRRRSSPS